MHRACMCLTRHTYMEKLRSTLGIVASHYRMHVDLPTLFLTLQILILAESRPRSRAVRCCATRKKRRRKEKKAGQY